MLSYASAVTAAKTGLLLGAMLLLLPVHQASARDGTSNLEVMVCPDATQSSLTITTPQSDSVVNDPKLVVSGEVAYISQIDFFIDDTYDHTVALGYSTTEYEASVSLSPGTHTIKLIATDSCSQTTHTHHAVVTYEPKTQPSVGGEIETEVDSSVVSPIMATPTAPLKNPVEKIIDTVIVPPATVVGEALDLGVAEAPSSAMQVANAARAALFIAGVTLSLSAVHIGALAALPNKLLFLGKFRRSATGIAAGVGLALIALVFML